MQLEANLAPDQPEPDQPERASQTHKRNPAAALTGKRQNNADGVSPLERLDVNSCGRRITVCGDLFSTSKRLKSHCSHRMRILEYTKQSVLPDE